MKVLFTNSPKGDIPFDIESNRSSTAYAYLGSMLDEQPQLGLPKVADAVIEDYNLRGNIEFAKVIEEVDPIVVGTTVYEFSIASVRNLVHLVRSVNPKIKVVIGGPVATLMPKSALKLTGADIALRGEADFTFRQTVEMLGSGAQLEDLLSIDGVVARNNGTMLFGAKSGNVPFIDEETLRKIRIHFELMADMQLHSRYETIDFTFSRGCPYSRCSYCQITAGNPHYRSLGINQTLDILRELSMLPYARYMVFGDAVFGGNVENAKQLIRNLSRYHFRVYGGQFSTDMFLLQGQLGSRIVDIDTIKMMKDVNLGGEIGVDHLSIGGLRKYRKFRYTPDEAIRVLRAFYDVRLPMHLGMISVGPDISSEDLAEHASNVLKVLSISEKEFFSVGSTVSQLFAYLGTAEYSKVVERISSDPEYRAMMLESPSPPLVLPEDDGFPYLLSNYYPLDPIVRKVATDFAHITLEIIPSLGNALEFSEHEMNIINTLIMCELLRIHGDRRSRQIISNIRHTSHKEALTHHFVSEIVNTYTALAETIYPYKRL